MVSPEGERVSSWPEVVAYVLRNYAQSSRASSAISDLRAVSQGPTKTGRELSTRLSKTISWCGDVHISEKVPTLCIHALHPATWTVFARYNESPRRAIYLDLSSFAQHEDDATRARTMSS